MLSKCPHLIQDFPPGSYRKNKVETSLLLTYGGWGEGDR
jgi:hypothetical protein